MVIKIWRLLTEKEATNETTMTASFLRKRFGRIYTKNYQWATVLNLFAIFFLAFLCFLIFYNVYILLFYSKIFFKREKKLPVLPADLSLPHTYFCSLVTYRLHQDPPRNPARHLGEMPGISLPLTTWTFHSLSTPLLFYHWHWPKPDYLLPVSLSLVRFSSPSGPRVSHLKCQASAIILLL